MSDYRKAIIAITKMVNGALERYSGSTEEYIILLQLQELLWRDEH